VKLFAQAGADVVFNYHRSRAAAQQIEQDARKHGTRVESLKADLGKMADAKKLVRFAIERLGKLDILVANAGIWNVPDLPIEKMSEREWDEMETRILEAEAALAAAQAGAADPAVASDHEALQARLEALALAQVAVDRLYARWAELEAKAGA